MNRNYKIILRKKTGELVVASEHAKGAKKSTVSSHAQSLLKVVIFSLASVQAISSYAAQAVALDPSYTSGVLITDSSGKVTGVNSANSANLQQKMKLLGSGTGAVTSVDNQFTTDLQKNTTFEPHPNGPRTAIPIETLDLDALNALGAITVKDLTTGTTLSDFPVWEDWDLSADGAKKEISWDKSDGSQGVVAVYDIDKIYIKNQTVDSLNFSAQRITDQPTEPFYQLTLEKINSGELTLQGDTIDWKPGQVKQSSLFIAETSAASIQQKTPIKVTFDNTASLQEFTSSSPETRKFGPEKILSGNTLEVDGKSFTINSVANLKSYNDALIKAITNNVIAASEYASRFNRALTSGKDSYELEYDPSKGYDGDTDYFFSPAMLAAIGKRSIFEASNGAKIELHEDVAAIGETWAHAYNVWLHDAGEAINHGTINIAHTNTQNALVESGSSYINKGNLNFNISRNGTVWADQVKSTGSTYINEGNVSVSTSAKRSPKAAHPNQYYKASRNIALEISDGASAENSATGQYFIGSTVGAGTATGVHINEHGTFTNKGTMTVGKNAAGEDQTLSGGVNSETLNLDDAFAAVSAYVDESKSSQKVRIENSGTININESAKNAVAMNVGFKDPTVISTNKIDVEVNNTGTILVDGANSAGLKAAGFQTIKADGIKNTGEILVSGLGSSGIFASNGAEIVNDGKVTVDGRQVTKDSKKRPYGVRADNALVSLENNSEIEVLGSYSVGLYARVGGTIQVNGGTIDVPKQTGAERQVVFWISGKNDKGKSSEILFAQPTTFELDNDGSTLFRIDNKATYIADAANKHTMNINGNGSTGYYITDAGTTFDSGQSEIAVKGDGATGIYVNGGAGLDNKVVLSDQTKLNVTGQSATVAVVDGNKYDIVGNKMSQESARLISKAKLESSGTGGVQVGNGAIGYWLLNTGELVHEGSIDFSTTTDAVGVKVEGGKLNNTAAGSIVVNGVGIDVYQIEGAESIVNNAGDVTAVDGIAAIRLNENAKLELIGSTGKVVKGEQAADAIRVHAGATLTTKDANLEVDGTGSGIHFLNSDGDSKAPFKLTGSGNIVVKGNDAAGITLEGQDASGNPAMASSDLDTRGSEKLVIQVKDAGGNGIVTNTSGSVASGTSVNIESATGQSALVVKGTTSSVVQTGNLSSNSTSAVVDLNQSVAPSLSFENTGSIISNATAGTALQANVGSKNVAFTNKATGKIQGNVLLGDGTNSISNQDSGNIQGKIIAGNGNNKVTLSDQSVTDQIELGDGVNQIQVTDQAQLQSITAGHGDNTLTLSDESKTNDAALGDGDNHIDVTDQANLSTLKAGDGVNIIHLKDQSKTSDVILGDGANEIDLTQQATLDTLTAGDGANIVNLKDQSKTQQVVLGDGGNKIHIHGETDNGSIQSGAGDDEFTLYAVNRSQNAVIFDQLIAGAGVDQLTLTEQSDYVLTDASKIQDFENLNIEKKSIFEINNIELALNNTAANTGIISVDQDSTYFINFDKTTSDYLMDYKVSGDGTIKTNTNNNAFDFSTDSAAHTQNNFTGTLQLGKGKFALENQNTQALTNATLQLDANGIATVKSGQGLQKIGGLTFNSGVLNFEQPFIASKPGALNSHLEVKILDVSKAGQVNIITDGFDNDFDADGALADISKLTLLEQDDGVNLVELVKATDTVTGSASKIQVDILDSSGERVPESEDSQQDIRQDGHVVAQGTYGLGATVWNENNVKDGLYAAYLLKKIEVLPEQTLNIESIPSALEKGMQLNAQVTGSGNIMINSNSDYIALANSANNYTGSTTVNKGTLKLEDDTVLGQENQHTSALILNAGTTVQFAQTTQHIGALQTKDSSQLQLDSGTLNINNGGQADGRIISNADATLNIKAGELTINGTNPDYHGLTQIQTSAQVNINDVAGLGDGDIGLSGNLNINGAEGVFKNSLSENGKLNTLDEANIVLDGNNSAFSGQFNNSEGSRLTASEAQHLGTATVNNAGTFVLTGTSDWIVNNVVQGAGDLIKQGNNRIELTENAAQYTGTTTIETGHLIVGNQTSAVDLMSKALIIRPNGTFSGFGSTAGDVSNQGEFIVGDVDKANSTNISQYLVKGNFNNAGKISLGGLSGTGSMLEIGGDYLSNDGQLYLNTILNEGKENTQTDQLKVAGDVIMGSGATSIYVKPVGGTGAKTQEDAIKVVDVGGKTAADAFKLASPVAIGLYEYTLKQGLQDQSWYLSNYVAPEPPVVPEPPVLPPIDPPEPPVVPEPPVLPPIDPPEPPVVPEPPVLPPIDPPEPPIVPEPPIERHISPMVGAYMSNQNALTMFNMTLHDRLGEPQYAEALKSDHAAHSMWLRTVISGQRQHHMNDALKVQGDQQLVQLGTDVIFWDQFSNSQNYRARLGVMAGFGQQDHDSISRTTGSRAKAKIENAYSVGVYGTIYQDANAHLESYVDAWAMYNWYDKNQVSMTGYDVTQYDSEGFNLSVEAGHTFVSQNKNSLSQWQFQPQVQLTYGQLDTHGSTHNSGLVIQKQDSHYLESRLGGRVTYLNNITAVSQIQPYAEFNWHHQYDQLHFTFNDDRLKNDRPEDRFEVQLGFEGNTGKRFNGWGNISYHFGEHHYEEVEAMAGIKYQW